MQRQERNSSKLTRLSQAVCYPDRWNKMNVKYAKIPFEIKTISELIFNAANTLKVTEQLFLDDNANYKLHVFDDDIDRFSHMQTRLK